MPSGSPEEILESLKRIEERLLRVERYLGLAPEPETAPANPTDDEEAEEELEVRVGLLWFARVGIVLLALGVVFLLTFPYQGVPAAAPSLAGYVLVIGLIALSRYLRTAYDLVSRYLMGGALLLLFFSTFRLAHFSPVPAIGQPWIEALLLTGVVGISTAVAIRRGSPYLASIAIVLGYCTALAWDEPVFTFSLIASMAVLTIYLQRRFEWPSVPLISIALAGLTHLVWALNNPLFGRQLEIRQGPEWNLVMLPLYALIFGVGYLRARKAAEEQPHEVLGAVLIGASAFGSLLLLTLLEFRGSMALWHVLASAVFLGLAAVFWMRRKSRYATFLYAMLGYAALSVAIVGSSPDHFVWLCWQSIIVVSTAVWFRSRFIVVGNFAVFVMVFAAYLLTAGTISAVSASFGIVALLSARLLNWQKDRLELKTEMMRNAYLLCALIIFPYTLYNTVPPGFVSLSWLCLAAGYYLVSRFLHLRKYRWMALLTTGLTILYVFLVDLVGLDPSFRIVSFLVLGILLLAISMAYSRRKKS
jgi:hypothetical protein